VECDVVATNRIKALDDAMAGRNGSSLHTDLLAFNRIHRESGNAVPPKDRVLKQQCSEILNSRSPGAGRVSNDCAVDHLHGPAAHCQRSTEVQRMIVTDETVDECRGTFMRCDGV